MVDEQYFKGKQTINYQYLQPGTYTLKLIIDANEDEKWTTGDYLKGVQPEKVYFYTKEIKVRSNWEYDINWNIQE